MGIQAKPLKRRRWLVWMIELLVILAVIFGVRAWQQRSLISGDAPAFDEITLAGEALSLASYQGEPVMLHFWASWCPMCEFGQDTISKINKDWKVVTVAYSSGEADEVQRYMKRKGIDNWVTVVDNDGELAKQYGVIGVPASFIIDPEGGIRFREVGVSSNWGLRLRLWLAGKLR